MVNNHLSAVLIAIYESITKAHSQFLVTSTRQITNPITLNFFPHTTILSEVYQTAKRIFKSDYN